MSTVKLDLLGMRCACGVKPTAETGYSALGWQIDTWAQSGFWCPDCKPGTPVYADSDTALVSFAYSRRGELDYSVAHRRVSDLDQAGRRELAKLLRHVADDIDKDDALPRARVREAESQRIAVDQLRRGVCTKTSAIERVASNGAVLTRLMGLVHDEDQLRQMHTHGGAISDGDLADILEPYCIREPK